MRKVGEVGMNAENIVGLWCDDISFCPKVCNRITCPRNSKNIRDRKVPHSFFVDIPDDCPKRRKVVRKKMKCPVCGAELHWDSDETYEDRGIAEGKGIISFYHCVSCGCDIDLYQPDENPYTES